MKPLFCFVGASATGKSTLCHDLCARLKMREALSVTTRPRRASDTDNSYKFISEEQFDKLDLVESVTYNGNHYGVEAAEVDASDLIVVQCDGARAMREYCAKRNRPCYVIGLFSAEEDRRQRMLSRGDDVATVDARIEYDARVFNNAVMIALCDRLYLNSMYGLLLDMLARDILFYKEM